MNSQTYVSDPTIWETFYKNMAEKKFNPYTYKPKQYGRGFYKGKSYAIPVRPHAQIENIKSLNLVTPVAAVEERAISEHSRDVQEGIPHVKVRRGIKRQRSQIQHIRTEKFKKTTSSPPSSLQVRKKGKSRVRPKKTLRKPKGNKLSKGEILKRKRVERKPKKFFKIDSLKIIFK